MGIPGVAYDGSMWVTAASSVGLVVGSVGLVAGGAALLARRVASGQIRMPDVNAAPAAAQTSRRVQPLRKSSSGGEQGISPPPRAESVDEAQ